MPKCFLLTAYPFPVGSPSYTWKTCGETSSLQPRTDSIGREGVYWEVDGVDMFGGSIVSSGSIAVVADNTPATYGSCTGCTPASTGYDCINGACILKTQYNTPGIYQSLEACQVACGTGCSGKCLSNSEWAQIEGLASQLRNKNCS